MHALVRKIVFCDINVYKKGHNIGYNQYILDNIYRITESLKENIEFFFLFNSSAKDYLSIPANINIHFLDVNLRKSIFNFLPFRNSTLFINYAKKYNADEVIFMEVDKFQIPFFLSDLNCKLSTIYFRPHHRIFPANDHFFNKFISKFSRFKKIISEKIILSAKNINRIYILNDREGVKYLNRFHKTNKFYYLPDPIFDYSDYIHDQNFNNSQVSFLVFGALSERKNITNIVTSYCTANFNKKTILNIVGGCDDDYYEYLVDIIAKSIPFLNNNKSIVLRNEFVSNSEMEQIHSSSNISLLLYKNFYGSSGLLGRAAKYKMFVIAPNVGLLNELVTEYNLGTTVDPSNTVQIAAAMEDAADKYKDFDSNGCEKFYLYHSPDNFILTLLC